MTAHEFYNKIKSLDLQKLKEEAVIANKDAIVKLNQSQLHFGRTVKDEYIFPSYTSKYLKRKMRMSSYIAPTGTPDLYVTGEFYGEMDVVVENGQYEIISFDRKSEWLVPKYNDIFGLNEENISKAQIQVTNSFLSSISNNLSN
jgi:hypothetical protein